MSAAFLKKDVLIVGSGINSLVAAALFSRAGRSVHVVERESVLGGCIRTEELTLPGFHHDTMSMAQPAFIAGPAYELLGEALKDAGLRYCNNSSPTGVLMSDGRSLVLSTSRTRNREAFDRLHAGDGNALEQAIIDVESNAELVFGLLGNGFWSGAMAKVFAKFLWNRGIKNTAGYFGSSVTSCRHWLESSIQGDELRALLAPWTLHNGLSPDSPFSALMTQVIVLALQSVGMPIPQGGNARTVDAFVKVISDAGGSFETDADVQKILVSRHGAYGVQLSDGREIHAAEVICSVTPTQLYSKLLDGNDIPAEILSQAKAYRYGKGNMQIHLALSEPPRWNDSSLDDVCYLHLSDGIDAVSKAVNEAERGLLPETPTICVSQPCSVDPSRAPAGKSILWIQLPECPRELKGDAASLIDVPSGAGWTPSIREAYADRVISRIAQHIPNLKRSILGRKVISPADLAKLNVNLVGGDPYGGSCELDQYMLWRPLRGTRDHSTPIRHLWHIGASTHPGPGLGGVSGVLIAKKLGAV